MRSLNRGLGPIPTYDNHLIPKDSKNQGARNEHVTDPRSSVTAGTRNGQVCSRSSNGDRLGMFKVPFSIQSSAWCVE